MAEQAARISQEDADSSQQNKAGNGSGVARAGDRRVTADSFRQLLARLKKPADAPVVEYPEVAAAPVAPPIFTAGPAEAAPAAAPIAAPKADLAVPLAPPPPAERHTHLNKLEQEKRERARAEVHAASLEIIARLRKAATSSQKAVEEFVQETVAKAQVEQPAHIEQAAPEPEPTAQPEPVAEAPAEIVAEAPAAVVEVEAEPTAAQFEEQELTAGLVAEAAVEPVAELPVEQPVAPAAQPVEPVAEAAPVAKQRRRHPFFPDVFLDDDEDQPEEVAAAPQPEIVAEQPVVEQPAAELPVAELPVAEQPVAELPVAELPTAEPFVAGLPAVALAQEPEYTEQSLVEAAAQLFAEPAAQAPQIEVTAELPVAPIVEAPVEQPVQSFVEELPAALEQPVAEAVAEPVEAQAPVVAEQPAPVIEEAPAPVAPAAPQAPTAERPAAVANAETDADAGHRDDLIEDEADAVKHLHGVEVKGIGDIARAVFSAPTPSERAAFLKEIAELTAAADPETPPREVLAASAETLVTPQPKARKVAPADDPFAKISPDVSSFVNNEEPSEDSGELARSLLDMMLSGPHAGLPQERALAADALLKLVPKVPTKALVTIAERVSLMEQPPHLLIARLINDPRIEISGPLLEQCNHISDQVLGKVIATGQVNLQRLIARRRHLSPAITDMLVDFDDASVILTLVRNAGASYSHAAFNKLVDHAASNEASLAPLSTRADLPAHVAFELFWLVPAQLRRYLLSRFLTDSETLTKILKITKVMQGVGTEGDGSGFANKADVEAFMGALIGGHREEAETKLATIAAITPDCAARIVGDQQGEPLAIIFKAIGLNRAQFEECMTRLQQPQIGIVDAGRQILELLSIFNSMSFNKARILLTYWDWAVQKHGPYASAV